MDELARIEAEAVAVAREAGARAGKAFCERVPLEFKGKKQDESVTAADREVEAFLRVELQRRFPDHGFVGEEQADDRSDAPYLWVLDPIDGTSNFAAGIPVWGVSLGLLHEGRPVVGCIWVPVGPQLAPGVYHARAGGGAWFDGERIEARARDDERGQVMALPGRSWTTFRFKRSARSPAERRRGRADVRTLGSITAEQVLVACGTLRMAVFVGPRLWDMAAGTLIVQEAGGVALVWQEKRWQTLRGFAPMAPTEGTGEAAYRHWSRPVLVGAPDVAQAAADRLVWHPRPGKGLRRLLGLDADQPAKVGLQGAGEKLRSG